MEEQLNEASVRSLARRRGYRVHKSRQWKHVPNLDNFGDYMLCDARTNFAVLGSRFDATLDDIEAYLSND
jgi:hypothetical protein